ncbi:structural maintenance of chromosomes protein 4-like [Anneissia japonica]|uniref:structural maintenance of chromosomes protein 4-like n=1 Tax=Anneissia japonica TaxID=1529436 RepID=UPI0014259074|nr:structural maintenance of chromosomes protein 4-like [Anneissia japonica]
METNEANGDGVAAKVITTNNTAMSPPPTTNSAIPRLMITKIANENFKSYAGKVVLGPFHKSFSCIVGPNGSGKSNVIDAMLFVFGYRASKIRSKKISVLVHKSDNFPNLNSCTVAVHFQKIIDLGPGEDEYSIVPGSQFVVSRTAFKDNTSQYHLDGKRVQFKEVSVKLRESGVDLDHNRFLILQGEVEQISLMKPKALTEHEEGMLEYLEDIIGSNKFKEPIEEISKKVEELNEERGEKLSRVKAVESEMNQLEEPMKEAEEFLRSENQITQKKNKLFQKYIHECSEVSKEVETKKNEVEEKMKSLHENLTQLTENNKIKGKDHKKLFKKYEKLCEEGAKKKEEFAEFERQDVKCRENLKYTKEKQKKLIKSLQKEKTKLEDLRGGSTDNEKVIEEMKEKKDKLESQLKKEEEKMSEIMASLKTATTDLQEEKEEKEKELTEMQDGVNQAKSLKSEAESRLNIQQEKVDELKGKLENMTTSLETASKVLDERKSSVKDLEVEVPELEKRLEESTKLLAAAKDTDSKSYQKFRDFSVKVGEAQNSLQSFTNRGAVLSALMAQKNNGNIPGIHGRLGDLGSIDEKYDVAISTACGALDYIVADNLETGEKCVTFLRDNNIGRATFIGLDKMEHLKKASCTKISTPDNVPRLYDLVKPKAEMFKTAFYYGLRDTLVAKDLDQATKIGLQGTKRHRVVTLQGQLIETSGTLSGGGKQVSKGRMGSKMVTDITPEQLATMKEELEQIKNDSQNHKQEFRRLEEEVNHLQKSLTEKRLTLKKHMMDIDFKAKHEATLKEQIKEAEKEFAGLMKNTNFKELEKNVKKFADAYDKVYSRFAKVESQVKSLHDKIMEVGNSKMKPQQTKLNKLNKEIEEANDAALKAQVAIKNSKKNIKRAEDKVASMEKEEEENAEAVKKIEEEFKHLEDEATNVLQSFRDVEERMKEMQEALDLSKQELNKIQEEENELKAKELEVKYELEKYVDLVKENQQKTKHWKKEIQKLSLHKLRNQEEEEKLEELQEEELNEVNAEEVQYEITVLEEKLAGMKPNLAAIQQYKKKEEAYLQRVGEYDELTETRNKERRNLEEMRKQRLDMFMKGFSAVNEYLKEMYQMITLGGDAELELVDSLDPFSEGIVFSVRPPKKSWKQICNLSGGEKTLSSLSLVFALHQFKPNPLYVMDEIDAALDFKNVSIVGHYITERTKNAQFIVISLRNNMFELADRLVGIYKIDNCSRTVAINPKKLADTTEISVEA